MHHILHFLVPYVRGVYDVTKILSLLGPNIWDFVPASLNKRKTLSDFQPEIKKWLSPKCSRNVYYMHLPNIHFT